MASIEQIAGKLASVIGSVHNQYKLTVVNLNLTLSVHSINGQESLNQPWRYEIYFTCVNKQIKISSILSQSASLTFDASHLAEQLTKISSLEKPTQPRTLYGVITEFNLLSVSKDKARYYVAQIAQAHQAETDSQKQLQTALKNVTLSARELVGILAGKSGVKLFANQGKVEIQAQNYAMPLD